MNVVSASQARFRAAAHLDSPCRVTQTRSSPRRCPPPVDPLRCPVFDSPGQRPSVSHPDGVVIASGVSAARSGESRARRRGSGRSIPRRTCASRRRRSDPPGSESGDERGCRAASHGRRAGRQERRVAALDHHRGQRHLGETAELEGERAVRQRRNEVVEALSLDDREPSVCDANAVVAGGHRAPLHRDVPRREAVPVLLARVDMDGDGRGQRAPAGNTAARVGRPRDLLGSARRRSPTGRARCRRPRTRARMGR